MNYVTCPICSGLFRPVRRDKRTCSPACKKAMQRGGWTRKKTLGQVTPGRPRKEPGAAVKGDNSRSQVAGVPVIMARFPEGTEVRFKQRDRSSIGFRWEVGRVCWFSRAGEECRLCARHLVRASDLNSTYRIPVATLGAVEEVWIWDLAPECRANVPN